MQAIEVSVADRAPFFVQLVVVAIETEQRAEQIGIEELRDRIDLVDTVFQWRAGQHECVRTRQPFDRDRGFGLPVFDALSFIENDHIRCMDIVDLKKNNEASGTLVVIKIPYLK